MLGLNFYPHLDIYHTAFRALALARIADDLEEDAYRILDYFSIFPFDVAHVRVRGNAGKRIAADFDTYRPYKWHSDPPSTFLLLTEYQNIALMQLRSQHMLHDGERVRINESTILSDSLEASMDAFLAARMPVLEFLLRLRSEFGLYGQGGLKDRSTLMTFKYDVKRNAVIN